MWQWETCFQLLEPCDVGTQYHQQSSVESPNTGGPTSYLENSLPSVYDFFTPVLSPKASQWLRLVWLSCHLKRPELSFFCYRLHAAIPPFLTSWKRWKLSAWCLSRVSHVITPLFLSFSVFPTSGDSFPLRQPFLTPSFPPHPEVPFFLRTWVLVVYPLLPSATVSHLPARVKSPQATFCFPLFHVCSPRVSYRVLHLQMQEKKGENLSWASHTRIFDLILEKWKHLRTMSRIS